MAIVSAESSPFRVLDFGQVQVQIQITALTDDNFRVHLEAETRRLNAYMRMRDCAVPRKAVAISHNSCELIPSASIRRQQADWLKDNEMLLRLVCHGLGVIVPNVLARNAMTAVLWLAPLPVPMKVHKDMDAAIAWAIEEADRIGGDVDEELRFGRSAAVDKYVRIARFSPESLDDVLRKRTLVRATA